MQNRYKLLFTVFLLIIIFCSCNDRKTIQDLSCAESLKITSPDSALALWESLPSPEEMRKGDYAYYCLLFFKQSMNVGNFGKINIMSNGDVYGNVNFPSLEIIFVM